MAKWASITYRDFCDVPRMVVVADGNNTYLLDGSFDDALDEYPNDYTVYLMPSLSQSDLSGSWEELPQRATRMLGRVLVTDMRFDETRRKSLDLTVLDRFTE